jgi:microcystin-dependent protein
MSRVKTFDSTGVATAGRLYAGDLNAIQDQYSDAANFAQTHDVSVLRLGEAGLQFLKFAAGEARLTGHLRTDGIVRGLGGIFAGTYTTTQRDAIPSGQRPYGLEIMNSTTNRREHNIGTDGSPNWQPVSQQAAGQVTLAMLAAEVVERTLQPGMTMVWPYGEAQIPAGCAALYGQAVSRAANPTNHAAAVAAGYPHGTGDGSTTFNLLDTRGRSIHGKDNTGGTAAGRISVGNNGQTIGGVFGAENVTLTLSQIPSHNHGGGSHTHTVNSHSHSGGTAGAGAHAHTIPNNFSVGASVIGGSGTTRAIMVGTAGLTDGVGDHAHGVFAEAPGTGGPSATVVNSEGGGTSHTNMPPGVIATWIIRLG